MPSIKEVESIRTWRDVLFIILSIGIRPCSGALIVLIITWKFGLVTAGILSVMAMAIGTGLIVAASAIFASKLRNLSVSKIISRDDSTGVLLAGGLNIGSRFVCHCDVVTVFHKRHTLGTLPIVNGEAQYCPVPFSYLSLLFDSKSCFTLNLQCYNITFKRMKSGTMSKKISDNEYPEPYPVPSREEALDAVKTLIAWAGDNPNREGLVDTPKRVVEAYREFFEGYTMNPD